MLTAQEMLRDPELKELGEEEYQTTKDRLEALESELQILLLPKDPDDERGVYLEIRAGAGGDESALFAGDLLRMYRSEEHTSELQSRGHLVCRLLLEKKKTTNLIQS